MSSNRSSRGRHHQWTRTRELTAFATVETPSLRENRIGVGGDDRRGKRGESYESLSVVRIAACEWERCYGAADDTLHFNAEDPDGMAAME